MEGLENDYVEVPGFEKKGFGDQFFSFVKVELPSRRVKLPIEMRISSRPLASPIFFELLLLGMLSQTAYSLISLFGVAIGQCAETFDMTTNF